MNTQGLKELETISRGVGLLPDLVQGGGGNTSVKLDDTRMAVKASGYRLDQVTSQDGFVVVDYMKIRDYFRNVDTKREVDFEKESVAVIKGNIVDHMNPKGLRPSIETGFHSFLQKYVIHTHSVYANILCCCKSGRAMAQEIFTGLDFHTLWIPYINPGFDLTLGLMEKIDIYHNRFKTLPNVIFMENHGVIVASDDLHQVLDINERVNQLIRKYLNINEDYPAVGVERLDDNTFESKTVYLQEYVKNNKITMELFKKIILYPDQLVYLGSNISINGLPGNCKVNIDTDTGRVLYRTGEAEARTIDETLTAFIYVVDQIQSRKLLIQTMSQQAIDFIKNMEGEKYRKGLLKNKG